MKLLVTKSLPSVQRMNSPNLGRLLQPRHMSSVPKTVEAGVPWAADNDAFGGFKVAPYLKMLATIAHQPGCLFVTAPDAVADAWTTLCWFMRWLPIIKACDLPVAYVLQDGIEGAGVPWTQTDAIFIGGSTEFKLGPKVRSLVVEAKRRGKYVHMGRVNGWLDSAGQLRAERVEYAKNIGCDSIDGSSWARWFDTLVPPVLDRLE